MSIAAPPRIDAQPRPGVFEPPPPGDSDPNHSDAGLVWRRMSFDEYQRLPEKPKAEWLDGWAVIHMEAAKRPHGVIATRLSAQLVVYFPNLEVQQNGGFYFGNEMLIPDIIVADAKTPGNAYLEERPLVVVEVLSPSTRNYDLGPKAAKYLETGVPQYWIVDPDIEQIIVQENAGDQWREIAVVDSAHPTTTVDIGQYGSVTLEQAVIFPDRTPGPK